MPITGYHAHIYFDVDTKPQAVAIREPIKERFVVVLGRWHDGPVGPHPCASYQIAFSCDAFGELMPWLMLNQAGLDILVHPLTGDELRDHTEYALWLGCSRKLNANVFRSKG